MSWSERSVQYHKRQLDCAIHRAYAQLTTDAPSLAAFRELLQQAQTRAPRFLNAPAFKEIHPGVEALVNLARWTTAHIRPVSEWPGTEASWRPAVASLASHLVCRYDVPPFLAASWYSTEPGSDRKRGWFMAHGRGASIRSLNLPIEMTRRMEHIFLASRDHLTIEYAMRRAELLALGASAEIVQAVLSTRLAADLSNGKFWRTFWNFLIANARDIDPAQIGPMIDFIEAIRHNRVTLETADGMVELDPPQPSFSMKGRTLQSMLRLMRDWHRSLGLRDLGVTWPASPLRPMLLEESALEPSAPRRVWQLMELTNSAQLRAEGAALHHCVATYAEYCRSGMARIWSLRLLQGEKVRHLLTIQVDLRRRSIVQARGRRNRPANGKPLRLLQDWAIRERLHLAL